MAVARHERPDSTSRQPAPWLAPDSLLSGRPGHGLIEPSGAHGTRSRYPASCSGFTCSLSDNQAGRPAQRLLLDERPTRLS